jgi:hypothetical protein
MRRVSYLCILDKEPLGVTVKLIDTETRDWLSTITDFLAIGLIPSFFHTVYMVNKLVRKVKGSNGAPGQD